MKVVRSLASDVIETLLGGGLAVIRTDTLYGVVARASDEEAVQKVYELKGRDQTKSPIVLIASLSQLYDVPSRKDLNYLSSVWPGKVSVILSSRHAPEWLKRGNNSVAYRIPADEKLCELLKKTGPLIAPSANPQGMSPAKTIDEAMSYFDDKVDIYVDGGEVQDDAPSRLVKLHHDGTIETLR